MIRLKLKTSLKHTKSAKWLRNVPDNLHTHFLWGKCQPLSRVGSYLLRFLLDTELTRHRAY